MRQREGTAVQEQLGRFERTLRGGDLDTRCVEQAVRRVTGLIDGQFDARNEHGDRKLSSATVRRTVRHLITAARNIGDGCPSRREARKLIRYAGCCTTLDSLTERASSFRGEHDRLVRRHRERREEALARHIPVDGTYTVAEIRTATRLRSVGRELSNCLKGPKGATYFGELREGTTEFWAVRKREATVGLVSVSADTREVDEMSGYENEDLDLPEETVRSILRGLRASDGGKRDSTETFPGDDGSDESIGPIVDFLNVVSTGLVEFVQDLESELEELMGTLASEVDAFGKAIAGGELI